MAVGARRSTSTSRDENPYWISFSDIMAGLLVIFILAVVYLVMVISKQKEEIDDKIRAIEQVETVRRQMLEEIESELDQAGIDVEISDNESVVRIPDDQLSFKTLSHRIPDENRKMVSVIGDVILRSLLRKDRLRYVDTVFIEGHTDGRPAPSLEKDNWGLSTFRAISVWNAWERDFTLIQNGLRLVDLRNREEKPIFSVSGFAASRRIDVSEATEEALKRNRRIDIRFTMFLPSKQDFKDLRKSISE